MNAVDETRSVFEAVQRFVGLSWSRLIALIGPGAASLWLYGAIFIANGTGAVASPLEVVAHLGARVDLAFTWSIDAASWLESHDDLHVPALGVAVVLACLAANPSASSGAWLTLSTLFLLTAVQLRGVGSIVVFLLLTLLVMGLAMLLDHRADRGPGSDWVSIPALSFKRWVVGPGGVVGLPLVLPFLIVIGMVAAFRIESAPAPLPSGAIR